MIKYLTNDAFPHEIGAVLDTVIKQYSLYAFDDESQCANISNQLFYLYDLRDLFFAVAGKCELDNFFTKQ